MSWLPKNKQKRNQLFMALGATVLAVGGMYFGLISPQYQELASIRKNTLDTQSHLQSIETVIKREELATNEVSDAMNTLLSEEGDMATGDIYAWTVDTMRHFKANYKVDVPEVGQPSMGDVDIISHFPYKQLRFSLRGTGYYHDIGKFIADLENKFPHMRVVNIEMNPVGGDSEKLSFSIEVIALVNSSS